MISSANTYLTFPILQKPGNSILMLLAWSTTLSTSTLDFSREIDVLRAWIKSEAGRNLCEQLAKDFQDSQSVHQFTLTTLALVIHGRLVPDFLDHLDQPITGSYLTDLDALFHDHTLGNSGRVAEKMAFTLERVLLGFGDCFEYLITFLQTTLDRTPAQLHIYEALSDLYIRWRVEGRNHDAALATVAAETSNSKMPEFRRDGDSNPIQDSDSDWVHVHNGDCTLPAVNTEYMPVMFHVPTNLY